MTELRIGLVGASRVAAYAMVAPSRSVSDVRITAIAARDLGRAVAFAKQHKIDRPYGSYASLIADPDVDLVYIGTPPNTHAQLALDAIGAGKHVLVEKPFAMSADEARRVYEAGLAARVQLLEAMHSPHHNLFNRVLQIIASGEIGKVKRLSASFNTPIEKDDPFRWDKALGGGALMDLGIYPLAWIRRIAGEDFEIVQAKAQFRSGVDARFSASLRFANGIECELSSSMLSRSTTAQLRVDGDIGRINVRNPIAPQLGHSLRVTTGAHFREEIIDGPSTYEAQLVAVRDSCLGRHPYPYPDTDFIDSMAAIDKIRSAF